MRLCVAVYLTLLSMLFAAGVNTGLLQGERNSARKQLTHVVPILQGQIERLQSRQALMARKILAERLRMYYQGDEHETTVKPLDPDIADSMSDLN